MQTVVSIVTIVLLVAVPAWAKKPIVVGPQTDPRRFLISGPGNAAPYIFGVLGAADASQGGHQVEAANQVLRRVGKAIASVGAPIGAPKGIVGQTPGRGVCLTGAPNGKPEIVRQAATRAGGETIGISPFRTVAAHRAAGAPYEGFTVIQLTALPPCQRGQRRPNFIGREINEVEYMDAAIVAGGRFGTGTEVLMAIEERKPLGVITGQGGIADLVKDLVRASTRAGKPPRSPILYDSNPERLVRRLVKAVDEMRRLGVKGPIGDIAGK